MFCPYFLKLIGETNLMCTVSWQENTIMKVAIYACVSTNKQDKGNQLVELWEFAAKQNWQVVTEYVDTVSVSGKRRAQFEGEGERGDVGMMGAAVDV
jgi:hypothetical protein